MKYNIQNFLLKQCTCTCIACTLIHTQTHTQAHSHKWIFHQLIPKSFLKLCIQKRYLSSQYAKIYTADTGNLFKGHRFSVFSSYNLFSMDPYVLFYLSSLWKRFPENSNSVPSYPLSFYFHTSLWCLKKTLKTFTKSFEVPQNVQDWDCPGLGR